MYKLIPYTLITSEDLIHNEILKITVKVDGDGVGPTKTFILIILRHY